MKEPTYELPWKIDEQVDPWRDRIRSAKGETIVMDIGALQDIEYILQACNNFPKAIELLEQAMRDLKAIDRAGLIDRKFMPGFDRAISQPEEFLKSLEDETTNT